MRRIHMMPSRTIGNKWRHCRWVRVVVIRLLVVVWILMVLVGTGDRRRRRYRWYTEASNARIEIWLTRHARNGGERIRVRGGGGGSGVGGVVV